ncbi:MAG TPA: TonB family protein [Thermoanaerobaculia bacterium]|jgi:protein TonB
MRDGVADVLAQRAKLDRGAASGLLISILLHGALAASLGYAAMHARAPKPVGLVNIQFAPMPASTAPSPRPAAQKPAKPVVPAPPKIEEPAPPRIEPPKPAAEPQKAVVPEKNTVPLSPFGQSTKKGSARPEAAKPAPAPPAASPGVPGTTTDVPVGGSGITGLEGGDFPYTIYIQSMHRRIGSNWFRQGGTGTPTVIYFRILRDGTIAEAKVETSSGNATYDRAALSAVRSSSPLNPLPFGYDGNYLGVHLTFR